MDHHITVHFPNEQEYEFHVSDGEHAVVTWEHAQAWIDEEYVNTRYQTTHPVGTAALADKVLRIAMAYGPQPFANNTAWAKAFARCTGRAIGKIKIRVDIANQSVAI
jgi:hypothetical protein